MTPLEGASVAEASTIGLDIAKHVFQAHGADSSGRHCHGSGGRKGEGTVNLMIEPTGSYTGLLRAAAMRQPWHP